MNFENFKNWWKRNGRPGRIRAVNMLNRSKKEMISQKKIQEWIVALKETEKEDVSEKDIKINNKIISLLKNPISIKEINMALPNLSHESIKNKIDEFINMGMNINTIGNFYQLVRVAPINISNEYFSDWKDEATTITFGVVGDTHLGNKCQQLTFLKHLYNIFNQRGITDVYHTGDITDGYYKNRGEHVYEIFAIGADEQVDYTVNNYPMHIGMKTNFIIGNHDATHLKNGGVDIGKMISKERSDMIYLGAGNARINLTPKCKLELFHPLDGTSYALSYNPQKYADSLSGGEKPNILLIGHYHKSLYFFYRNIHILLTATTCSQTPWMRGKKIAAAVGGWIITAKVSDDGTVTNLISEYIPQYIKKENDY